MDRYQAIYADNADGYEELVSHEDHEGLLLPALLSTCELRGRDIVEVGAGTGRVTRLLADVARSVLATEPSSAMLAVAGQRLRSATNVRLATADVRALPLADESVDVAVAGWVLAHFRSWYPDTWRTEVSAALGEMRRTLRPNGGATVLIDTLGTGQTEPSPPSRALAEYYGWLEQELGFTRTWVRTDYRFSSVDEAARITGAFFGAEFGARVRDEQWTVVPECTGIWTRQ